MTASPSPVEPYGQVYCWVPDPLAVGGGRVELRPVTLQRLESPDRLCGRFVEVRNAGRFLPAKGRVPVPLGDARPGRNGQFLFDPGRGGGRMDKASSPDPGFVQRYVEAARFGEVNAYYHLDRMALRIDELLHHLEARSLPRVTVLVNAHDSAAVLPDGSRDGVQGTRRWLPFQGGHYRLSTRPYGEPKERLPIWPAGEIHLGPGWRLLEQGALPERVGGRYRANASHNAGILYHEYGHHLTRHTADFQANELRSPERQTNRKSALDEGTCDYWSAVMLGTPYLWAWHQRYDHPRGLTSARTMSDFDPRPGADPHANGTIWGAALWSLRAAAAARQAEGGPTVDTLVLAALLLLGSLAADGPGRRSGTRRMRSTFSAGVSALLRADELLTGGGLRERIAEVFLARGILPDLRVSERLSRVTPDAWREASAGRRGRP